MTSVQVRQDGTIWRVVEADGKPCMHNRNPSDGGGFRDRGAADKLGRDINRRRRHDADPAVWQAPAEPAGEPEYKFYTGYDELRIAPATAPAEPQSESESEDAGAKAADVAAGLHDTAAESPAPDNAATFEPAVLGGTD